MFRQNSMDTRIRNIYVNMMKEKKNENKIDSELQEEIIKLLEDNGEHALDAEYEKLRDTAFLIAAMAEENGFVKGFKYAFQLFAECVAK